MTREEAGEIILGGPTEPCPCCPGPLEYCSTCGFIRRRVRPEYIGACNVLGMRYDKRQILMQYSYDWRTLPNELK